MKVAVMPALIIVCIGSSYAWADDVEKGPLTATDKIVARFMELDTDETLGVSYQEYEAMVLARAKARFALMDQNHDGEVDADEYRSFWKSQKARYYRLKR